MNIHNVYTTILSVQVAEEDHQDSNSDIAEDIDLDSECTDEIHSTGKRAEKWLRPSKCQKEAQEDILLKKAIACMEKAGNTDHQRRVSRLQQKCDLYRMWSSNDG